MGNYRGREVYTECRGLMTLRAILTVVCLTLLVTSCHRNNNDDELDGEIFADQVADATGGNVIVTVTGMSVYLLGVKEGDEVGTAFLRKYVGETIHVIADSNLDQDPAGTDSIWGYAVLDDGLCINHMLLKQEPQLYSPVNLEDSLDSFRPKKDDVHDIQDMGLYLKQRAFLIEVPVGGGLSNYGTAFFINDESIAITNHHVFDGSNDAMCHLYSTESFDDNGILPEKNFKAYVKDIICTDTDLDITVFKVSVPQGIKSNYLCLARKHIAQGEKIYTIGNPVGQAEILTATLTDGIVSGYREQHSEKPLVQYTLSTNYGNSGGPVCDKSGKVIAVHCMGDKTKQNVNFGVDILRVRNKLGEQGIYYGGK